MSPSTSTPVAVPQLDDVQLVDAIAPALTRWPCAGLAVGVVHGGHLAWFHGHGVADLRTRAPITADTGFRIASITKTFTAVAVMQLVEQDRLHLDDPVNDHLTTFKLVPAKASYRPATIQHLLTHTAGIGYWRRLSDLLHPGTGSGDTPMQPPPALADYYRDGLLVEVEPGTKWMYSNHGFAALGQIVEDVTGQPYPRYLRDHVLQPLGMDHTALTPDPTWPTATGTTLRRHGLEPADTGPLPLLAAGGLYSTTGDLSRYIAALLDGGAGERGRILEPETLAAMFQPHHQPDPRVPGAGLGFHLDDMAGHRTVGHTGILSGFLSAMLLAPDDGMGVVVLTNSGDLTGRGAPDPLSVTLLRRLLDLPDDPIRRDIPPRPDIWKQLCGWYSPDPGPLTNLFTRAIWGAGADVTIDGGQLMVRPLHPLPTLRHGMHLHPDDPDDPYVFRVDFAELGWAGTQRAAFSHDDTGPAGSATRLTLNGFQFHRRPDARNPRHLATTGLALGATTAALTLRRRHTAASG